jgi:preprotein translocase subunit Sec61beta
MFFNLVNGKYELNDFKKNPEKVVYISAVVAYMYIGICLF